MRVKTLLIAMLVTSLALAGCLGSAGDDAPAPTTATAPASIEIVASDFALRAPPAARAGVVEVKISNVGTELHHVTFYKIEAGRTAEELRDALAATRGATPSWATAYGGPNVAAPGAPPTVAFLTLDAGEYVLACLIPSPDHQMHAAKGMMTTLRVVPSTGSDPATPTPTATVTLRDFSFSVAPEIVAGKQSLLVKNEGTHTHELVIFELFGNATTMEFLQAIEDPNATSPPPGRPVGGTTPITAGKSVTVPVDLTPGRYTFVCFDTTGTTEHQPHFLVGMVREFTVA